jgi:predicted nucleic acid-binding Zn ribbon protein
MKSNRGVSTQDLLVLQAKRKKDFKQSQTKRRKSLAEAPPKLEGLLNEYFKKNPDVIIKVEETRALMAWEKIVGTIVAEASWAMAVRNDVLQVEVVDSLWMQQLTFSKRSIVQSYRKQFPQLGIKDIFFSLRKRR